MNVAQHSNIAKDSITSSRNSPFSGSIFFQPKLSINTPGDTYEQEADAMADKVMRMKDPFASPPQNDTFFKPAPVVQRKTHSTGTDELEDEYLHRKEIPNIQRKCAACAEDEKQIHRKENSNTTAEADSDLSGYVSSLSSSGQPLSESSRQFFEPRFGQDFSNVKIHTDSVAAKSAQSVNALAYTTGSNIVFNQGQYSPNSESGQKLMAHELTHVVQQTQGRAIQTKTIQRKDAPYIKKITVHLTPPQTADLEWEGTPPKEATGKDHFTVSSGKGYGNPGDPPDTCERNCCTDAKTQCAPPWSKPSKVGSCCTFSGNDFWTGKPETQHNGWNWWTPIQPYYSQRGVALHQHTEVTGQPVSHGCVRMDEDNAKRIFDFSNRQKTKVNIDGSATPVDCAEERKCNSPAKSATPAPVQRKCAACSEENRQIHRKENPNTAAEINNSLSNYVSSLNSSGQALPESSRQFFEPRFGQDFSNVKIHTDSVAAKSAQSVNALAYTTGNNIVFNQGQYSPNSESGQRLMAHELTHVVQQSNSNSLKRFIQRAPVTLNSGRVVGNVPAPAANIKEDVLDVMDSLHSSWSLNNADFGVEYPVASARPATSNVPPATIPHTIAAIDTNEQPILSNQVAQSQYTLTLSNNVGRGMPNVKADITTLQNYLHAHWFLQNTDFTTENTAVSSGPDPVNEASIPKTLEGLTKMKIAKLAEGGTTNVMRGTHALTATQRAQTEAALIPGASSSGGAVSVPSPQPICTTPALETEIRANIVPYLHTTAADFNTRRASPPVLPVPQMNSMADIVQNEIQTYFGGYLRGATNIAGSEYTPGSYSLRGQLRDQSTTVHWQDTAGRKNWINYWISTRTNNNHHCNQNDLDLVAEHMATDPALIPDIDTTIQSWPAEATGGININPYIRDPGAGSDEIRRGRWEAFTTIMHEAIHHLAHPNFVATYMQMRDDSMQVLKEGFDEMFRHELWQGAGTLLSRIAQPAYTPKRTIIEGSALPYNSGVIPPLNEYPQIAQATQIRNSIGDANAKAAYFLGHTELLGLGAGSHSLAPGHTFNNTGMYNTTDPSEENVVLTTAGETYNALKVRLNATAGNVTDAATGNSVTAASGPLPPRVRVAGIRHVTVIAGDTLNSIASQNGVTPFDIIRANNLSASTVTIGQRLIIPIH